MSLSGVLSMNTKWALSGYFLALGLSLQSHPIWAFTCFDASLLPPFNLSPISEILVILALGIAGLSAISLAEAANSPQFNLINSLLCLILMLAFRTNSFLAFYVLFESSLIPIFLIILGWGYQPERLAAGMGMMIYTTLASLPLLIFFLSLGMSLKSFQFDFFMLFMSSQSPPAFQLILSFLMGLAFLVKVPMFMLHLWLPKAHVEAPVMGSMILASILLKLGGYGLIRVSPLIPWGSGASGLSALSLTGGALISVLCLRQWDMKILIAYSSVSHMSLVIYSLLTMTPLGLSASYSMMIAHGVGSPGLFLGASLLVLRSHSRSMSSNKGGASLYPYFSLMFFFLILANMGAPPTINLLSEIMNLYVAANSNPLMSLPFLLSAGVAVAYSLLLYSNTQHGPPGGGGSAPSPLKFQEMGGLLTLGCFVILPIMGPTLMF